MSQTNTTATVKTVFEGDIRRLRINLGTPDIFGELLSVVTSSYRIPSDHMLIVRYQDDEQEEITLSSHAELMEAFRVAKDDARKVLKLFISASTEEKDNVSISSSFVTVDEIEPARSDVDLMEDLDDMLRLQQQEKPMPAPPVIQPQAVPVSEVAPTEDLKQELEQELEHEPETASAPVPVPVPVREEVALRQEDALPLLRSFLQNPTVKDALVQAAPVVRDLVKQGASLQEVVQRVLKESPQLAEHSLIVLCLPHLDRLAAQASAIVDWDRSTVLEYVNLAESVLDSKSFAMQEVDLEGVFSMLNNAVKTGAKLELDVFWTPKPEAEAEAEAQPESKAQKLEPDEVKGEPKPKPKPAAVHKNVQCDVCGVNPMTGVRYKCTRCPNYDLCEECEAKEAHPAEHVLMKIRVPVSYHRGFGPFRGFRRGKSNKGAAAAGPCSPPPLKATFVEDVTLPDLTGVRRGSVLTKTWAIKNTGERMWPAGTQIVWMSGEIVPVGGQLAKAAVPLAAPGELVHVSVNVVMPLDGSTSQRVAGNFRLETAEGKKFGHRVWVSCLLAKEAAADEAAVRAAKGEELPSRGQSQEEKRKPEPEPEVEPELEFKYARELVALRGMGFGDDDINKYLLLNNKGNVQRVVDWLLAHAK